jgi:CheY-like chemotaxis protein
MHRTYICDVERGSRNVSLETIERLAQALQISMSTLFSYKLLPEKPAARPVTEDKMVDILLVEDNPDDANLTLRTLNRANIANRIQVVRDGAAALDYLFCIGAFANRHPGDLPQLILLDLNLPKIDGMEVLRQIKANLQTRPIPVVVLTVSNRAEDAIESRKLGAEAYIAKPVDFKNFSEVVPKLNLHWAVLKSSAVASAQIERV